MAMATTGRPILDFEKSFWEAMKQHDRASIEGLTADNYMMVMEDGIYSSSGRDLAQMLTSREFDVRAYEIAESDAQTCMVTDDVAIVAYRVHNEFGRNGDYKTRDSYNMSVWKRDGDTWRCVAGADVEAAPAMPPPEPTDR
jgi:hypothetical protein